MIVVPASATEVAWCREFFRARGQIGLGEAADWLVWTQEGMPTWVIAFDDWMGSTCQLYMVSAKCSPPPRSLIKAVFRHGFNVLKRTHIFGFVNSANTRAMRLDIWLGFREVYRVPGAHEGGGDIVVFEMTPADCRWLKD